MNAHPLQRVSRLWQVESGANRLSCGVYRDEQGSTLLRLESPVQGFSRCTTESESPDAVVFSLPFGFEPRMLARARAVRASLLRQGWSDVEDGR